MSFTIDPATAADVENVPQRVEVLNRDLLLLQEENLLFRGMTFAHILTSI